jgi:hypothetical protein
MPAVELHLDRAGFANALGAMRDWLDHNGVGQVKFETSSEPAGTILIRVEFGGADAAQGFASAFSGQVIPIPETRPPGGAAPTQAVGAV